MNIEKSGDDKLTMNTFSKLRIKADSYTGKFTWAGLVVTVKQRYMYKTENLVSYRVHNEYVIIHCDN